MPTGSPSSFAYSQSQKVTRWAVSVFLNFNMVWIYQYLRYFLFKPFLIHVQPLKFSQDCIDKFFFLNKAVAASLIAFSFLPVSAVPRFIGALRLETASSFQSPAQKGSTTFSTEYFAVEEVMLPVLFVFPEFPVPYPMSPDL